MASLFTAPNSRAVVYSKKPPSYDELLKLELAQYNSSIWSSVLNTAKRVAFAQVPFVSKLIPGQNNLFTLPGVQTIKWTMAREVTEQYGLQSYTMLPWYTKAVVINVTGKAYLGAWVTDLSSSNGLMGGLLAPKHVTDFFRDEMRDMDKKLNGTGLQAKSAQTVQPAQSSSASNLQLVSSLAVGTDGEPGSIKVLGFVKSFEVDEDVNSPFVQKYTLSYVGVDEVWYAESRARSRTDTDRQAISSSLLKLKK